MAVKKWYKNHHHLLNILQTPPKPTIKPQTTSHHLTKMKFLATLSLLALTAVATALPQADSPSDNTPVDIGPIPPAPTGIQDGAPTYEIGDPDSEPADKRGLEKRSFHIQVWADINRGGRHQQLTTDVQKCYNLGNHWPNSISSLQVPRGHGCVFYNRNHCPQNGAHLTVPGATYVANLGRFNDKINSYLCYNN
ncbi:hypothetical protein K458DRAFT_436045 [Lentithecium fluviatile CBS 122367]|uniref:Uncharacterized protein n=1 Tax=Lentithecium fluviatile CBS 122367 TaxID=1168545 RepID=A0A6G1IIS9_9PLEO|nr:hypothetical protein K458DRAFT_436045 [Lentithecium fluviatile CBS 122367]